MVFSNNKKQMALIYKNKTEDKDIQFQETIKRDRNSTRVYNKRQ